MNYEPDRLPPEYPRPRAVATGQEDLLSEATEICLRCHQAGKVAEAPEYAGLQHAPSRRAGRNLVSRLVKPIEQRALLALAQKRGVLFSNQKFTDKWISRGKLGGAENDVYHNGKTAWYKRNNLSYHSSYLEFFYRIALHNHFFQTSPITLVGFVVDQGRLKPITTQPDIVAERGATSREVFKFMTGHGFSKIPGTKHDYHHKGLGIRIEDLHNENVLKTDDGLEFIDPVLYLDEAGKERRIKRLRNSFVRDLLQECIDSDPLAAQARC